MRPIWRVARGGSSAVLLWLCGSAVFGRYDEHCGVAEAASACSPSCKRWKGGTRELACVNFESWAA
jgi:hypothetical protein